jgi:hypothetical protein
MKHHGDSYKADNPIDAGFLLRILLAVMGIVGLIIAIPTAFFIERKAAICAHIRLVVDSSFADLSLRPDNSFTDTENTNRLVFAKGQVKMDEAPQDYVLGVQANSNSIVLERVVEML